MMMKAVLLVALVGVAHGAVVLRGGRPLGTPKAPLEGHYRAPHPAREEGAPIMIPNTDAGEDEGDYQNEYHTRAGDGMVIIGQGEHRYNADGEHDGGCCMICDQKTPGSRKNRCRRVCGDACSIPKTEGEGLDTDARIGDNDMTKGYAKKKAVDGSTGPRKPKAAWARYPKVKGATGPAGATGPVDVEPHVLAPSGATGATGATGAEEAPAPEEAEEAPEAEEAKPEAEPEEEAKPEAEPEEEAEPEPEAEPEEEAGPEEEAEPEAEPEAAPEEEEVETTEDDV